MNLKNQRPPELCVQWALTGHCNYRCRHCYVSGSEEHCAELDSEEMLALADLLVEAGVKQVSFTGGEPLLRRDFLEITRRLTSGGVTLVQIATNGSLIDRPLLTALKALGQRPRISISYDGDGGVHDELRGVPGATQTTQRAFLLCRDEGLETASEMTLYTKNAPFLRESIRTLHSWGCASVKVLPLFPVGATRSSHGIEPLSLPALFQLFTDYITAYYADGMPVEIFLYGFFYSKKSVQGWLVPMERFTGDEDAQDCLLCGHALTSPYLSAEGRLLPCAGLAGFPAMVSSFPRLLDVGFDGALDAEAFRRFYEHTASAQMKHNAKCADCPTGHRCKGGCRLVPLSYDQGFYGCDDYCCEFFHGGWKERIPDAIRQGKLERLLQTKLSER
jgi:radical SAM protein with 4Fe4S-binding SPASM domain